MKYMQMLTLDLFFFLGGESRLAVRHCEGQRRYMSELGNGVGVGGLWCVCEVEKMVIVRRESASLVSPIVKVPQAFYGYQCSPEHT